jgi:hypothetical protein
MMWASDDE